MKRDMPSDLHLPVLFLRDASSADAVQWLCFRNPVTVVEAVTLSEVEPALARVEDWVRQGYYAAGFLTYEASPAFDGALTTYPSADLPLLWFGIFKEPQQLSALPDLRDAGFQVGEWHNPLSEEAYTRRIQKIRDYIASGDTYQVNYTTRFQADFQGDPYAFFVKLNQAQPAPFAAYCDMGQHVFCSGSPELFFELQGNTITCCPMKGTRPRGLTSSGDAVQKKMLLDSEKDRAENLMIVDMIRNDLGRVARTGSVQVTDLFNVERYATVFQMTSRVQAETEASLTEIFKALFPCASITGAPKVRTMQIIHELEDSPRGIYTGCIGYIAPDRKAQFNVSIRSVHIDREKGTAEYGAGGGIVWDSQPEEEWQECQTKASVLMRPRSEFQLLETLLWKPSGFTLLREHLDRLMDSSAYFDFSVEREEVLLKLSQAAQEWEKDGLRRVRLLVSQSGKITVESVPFQPTRPRAAWRVRLAKRAVDSSDVFLYHKTTCRKVYEAARADFDDVEDVLLWNERGEVTESTIANLVVQIDGRLYTPPVSSGLLAGTLRHRLLQRKVLKERVLTVEDVSSAARLFLINSLRGWIPVQKSLITST